MSQPDVVLATARAIRTQLARMLPAAEALAADAELGRLLDRADAGQDVTDELLEALRRREVTRDAAFGLLRGERGSGYLPLLGAALHVGARYVCPVSSCNETGDRLDDSEPEPRCPVHGVTMERC